MGEQLGLFGGSFNPVHHGHLIIARAVAERLNLARVIFLPSSRPPHKLDRTIVEGRHRAAMVELAIDEDPLFEFSDFDLCRDGPTYTIDTVSHFREQGPGPDDLYWLIGADSLAELVTWRRIGDLVNACRIVAAARPGWETIDWGQFRPTLADQQVERLRAGVVSTPHIDISSTDIRARVAEGRPIRYLVPTQVRNYIERHGLYR